MKDIYAVFNEKLAEVDKAGKRREFNERAASLTSVEAKINCAEYLLGTTVKESSGRVRKKNGREENFTEGNPFNEGRRPGGTNITEVDKVVAKREPLVESVMTKCKMTEASARAFLGLKEKAPEGLTTERQKSEYRFARRCGISEADSMKLAKMPFSTR